MSNPRLATSVATKTRHCWDLNFPNAARRRFCVSNECNATLLTPNCVNIPLISAVCSHVETKIMALLVR